VNVASRTRVVPKVLRPRSRTSEMTVALHRIDVAWRELDAIGSRDAPTPVKIYELLAADGAGERSRRALPRLCPGSRALAAVSSDARQNASRGSLMSTSVRVFLSGPKKALQAIAGPDWERSSKFGCKVGECVIRGFEVLLCRWLAEYASCVVPNKLMASSTRCSARIEARWADRRAERYAV